MRGPADPHVARLPATREQVAIEWGVGPAVSLLEPVPPPTPPLEANAPSLFPLIPHQFISHLAISALRKEQRVTTAFQVLYLGDGPFVPLPLFVAGIYFHWIPFEF